MTRGTINIVDVKRDEQGNYEYVEVQFGPHYYVNIGYQEDGELTFILGATHHGFKADASEIGSDLERLIDDIRNANPDSVIDDHGTLRGSR